MNKISLILASCILLIFASQARAGLAIVSDIDDTIKITHVNQATDSFIRGPLTATAFLGMSDLYNAEFAHAQSFVPNMYYVSGSPKFLGYAVKILLGKYNFPVGEIALRDYLGRPEIYEHKMKKIKEIMSNNSIDQFLMFGDDTERDFEVYHDLQELYPNRILASYIHLVENNKKLPKDVIGYFNAADLALREFLVGRISELQAKEILNKFLTIEIDEEELLPAFAACPTDGWLMGLASRERMPSALQLLVPQVEEKLKAKCAWNMEQIAERMKKAQGN